MALHGVHGWARRVISARAVIKFNVIFNSISLVNGNIISVCCLRELHAVALFETRFTYACMYLC